PGRALGLHHRAAHADAGSRLLRLEVLASLACAAHTLTRVDRGSDSASRSVRRTQHQESGTAALGWPFLFPAAEGKPWPRLAFDYLIRGRGLLHPSLDALLVALAINDVVVQVFQHACLSLESTGDVMSGIEFAHLQLHLGCVEAAGGEDETA